MREKAIVFDLKGTTAFFKRPDVNKNIYFTFSHIHRVAFLGMLGAVWGKGGYSQQGDLEYPEFYKSLENLEYALIPMSSNGYFTKSINSFNNSTGFASHEDGGNLITTEQWIENPHWKVVLKYDEDFKELFNLLENNEGNFIPYLGKNDHFASIENLKIVEIVEKDTYEHVDSLFKKSQLDDFQYRGTSEFLGNRKLFFLEETMPSGLMSTVNHYTYDVYIHTNMKMFCSDNLKVYDLEGFNVAFI